MAMQQRQEGFFLIEALVAILIFSLGVLGMVAMGAAAMTSQSDAQYRTEAASLVNEIAGKIALGVDRADAAAMATSLAGFAHQPSGANCDFSGAASADVRVTDWIDKVKASGTGLPGADNPDWQQITVDASSTGFNRVQVTVCWQSPSDKAPRRHTLVTYVN